MSRPFAGHSEDRLKQELEHCKAQNNPTAFIDAELKQRELENNIKIMQSDIQKLTKPHWTLTPTFWMVLITTIASLFPIYQYVSAKFQYPASVENQSKSKTELQTTELGTSKKPQRKPVQKMP